MNKTLLLLAALAAAAAFTACGPSRLDTAVNYYEGRKYQDGIDHFQKKIATDDGAAVEHFEVHRYVLMCYKALGRLQEGETYYARFKDPALKAYLSGLLSAMRGIHDKAVEHFREAAKLRPREYVVHYDLGLSLVRLRKMREGILALTRTVRLNEGFANAWYDLGLIYAYAQGNHDVGRVYVEHAIGKFSDAEAESRIDARITLGKLYELLKKPERALAEYEAVAQKDFRKLAGSVDLGALYLAAGQKDKAMDYWKRAVDLLGLHTPRGRYFLAEMRGISQPVVDLTGVPYYFASTRAGADDKTVYANEEEYFFSNKTNTALFDALGRAGLHDLRLGWETWMCEYGGIMVRPEMVRRWLQARGIVDSFKLKSGEQVFVSVVKSSWKAPVLDEDLGGSKRDRVYWYQSDVKIGVTRGDAVVQALDFPVKQLVRVRAADVDGDGLQDLVAGGIDARGVFTVQVFLRRGARWEATQPVATDLEGRDNGVLFLDLDDKPGLECVRLTTAIAWPEVLQLKNGAWRPAPTLYAGFAADFVKRFPFCTPAWLAETEKSGRADRETLDRYRLLVKRLEASTRELGALGIK